MKLSIIIPTYNCEKYIGNCLDSCLSQDIPKDEYEIICVDDGSVDESLKIIQKYIRNYNNIRCIEHGCNLGVSSARNSGLKEMKGDYCLFIDADDFISDNCLNKCLKQLEKGGDYLLFGRVSFFDNEIVDREDIIANVKGGGITTLGYITNKIIKRSFIGDLLFKPNIFYGEDELFMFELRQNNPQIIEYDVPIYYYRIHDEQATHLDKRKTMLRIDSVIDIATYVVNNPQISKDEATFEYVNSRLNIAIDSMAELSVDKRIRFLIKIIRLGFLKTRINDKKVLDTKRYINKRKGISRENIRKKIRKNKFLVYAYGLYKKYR